MDVRRNPRVRPAVARVGAAVVLVVDAGRGHAPRGLHAACPAALSSSVVGGRCVVRASRERVRAALLTKSTLEGDFVRRAVLATRACNETCPGGTLRYPGS